MQYTKNINLYLADIDDSNKQYVPGFTHNFQVIDSLIGNLITQELIDPYANDSSELNKKKVITDGIVVKYQAHIDSFVDINKENKLDDKFVNHTGGTEYTSNLIGNPHAIDPTNLFCLQDLNKYIEYYRKHVSQDNNILYSNEILKPVKIDNEIVYNPYQNMGHNSLIYEINNINDDEISYNGEKFPRKRDAKIDGSSKTAGNDRTVINYENLYLQDIGGNSYTEEEAKLYRNHKYIYVDTENQILNYETDDNKKNKHVSHSDIKHFESHLQNLGVYTTEENLNKFPEIKQNDKINVNPHRVTASDLYDIDSVSNDNKIYGKNAIIKELNKEIYNNINAKNNKIYWNLIDKDDCDGNGNKANINSIPIRLHDSLQEINSVNVLDTDETFNKHINNKLGNKWDSHVNTELKNPHKTKAEQLYNTKNENNATVAINEQINKLYVENIDDYNHNKILWNAIDKNNSDGKGTEANIKDIPIRNHDDLQSIEISDISNLDYSKNKHLSSYQIKKLQEHCDIYEKNNNPHNTSPKSLIGDEIEKINKSIVDISSSSIYENTLNINLNISNAENDLYIDLELKQAQTDNIDIYVNNNWITQLNNSETIYNFIIKNNFLNETNNKIIFVFNTGSPNIDFINSINIYNKKVFYGKNAIINEINRENSEDENSNGVSNDLKILWKRIDNKNSSISDLEKKSHFLLTNINGYEIEKDSEDINDNSKIRNKHISHEDGILWQSHVDTKNGSNPHNLNIKNIKGDNRDGVFSIIDILNLQNTQQEPANENTPDDVGSNYISWDIISKKNSNIINIENRSHQSLQDILSISFNNDNIQNKHISNKNANKWETHVDDISVVGTGNLDNNEWSNPHKIVAASLYSHKDYPLTNNKYNGGNAIIDAVNDFANNQFNWNKINKSNSNITDIENRNHNSLHNIEKPVTENNDLSLSYTLHISQKEYDDWQSHKNSTLNPHKLNASQIISSQSGISSGANAIITEINLNTTTSKILSERIDYSNFSITDIPAKNRQHNSLTGGIYVVSGEENVLTTGHVNTEQVKKWNNHIINNNNPHNVVASQINLDLSEDEKENSGIINEDLKNVILEIDEFRNRSNVGIVNIDRNLNNPKYYFDSSYNLYIPKSELYLNDKPNYAGKIHKYYTPTLKDTVKPSEISFNEFYKFNIEQLPKNKKFYVIARLFNNNVLLNIETADSISNITDGQFLIIMHGYISAITSDDTYQVNDGYCYAYGNTALGMTEKLFNRMIYSEQIKWHSGLLLNDDNTHADDGLYFTISNGSLWYGTNMLSFNKFSSYDDDTHKLYLVYNKDYSEDKEIIWNFTNKYDILTDDFPKEEYIRKAIHSYYQEYERDSYGKIINSRIKKVDISSEKPTIVCNFIYLDVLTNRIYIILGDKLFSSLDDFDKLTNSIYPEKLPNLIRDNCIMVGILLCDAKNDKSFVGIYKSFDIHIGKIMSYSSTQDHTQLQNINTDQFWHLNKIEYDKIAFLINDTSGEESGLELSVTKELIDKRITEILNDNHIQEEYNSITELANLSIKNHNEKLNLSGGTLTGTLKTYNQNNKNSISIFSKDNYSQNIYIGKYLDGNIGKNGYFIEYNSNNSILTLYSQNNNGYQTDSLDIKKILECKQNGEVEFFNKIIFNTLNIKDSIFIDNGLNSISDISLDNNDSSYGMFLKSSLLFKHEAEQNSSIFRSKNEKFMIDTYGDLYINTDLSRSENSYQENPVDPKGLKLQNHYNVYICNNGTNEEPNYPIKLIRDNKSIFQNGIFIGNDNDYIEDSSSKLIIAGNLNMNNNIIKNIKTLSLGNFNITNKDSYLYFNNTSELNVGFGINTSVYTRLKVNSTEFSLSFNQKTSLKVVNDSIELYYNNQKRLQTTNDGILITGKSYSTDETTAFSDLKIKKNILKLNTCIDKIMLCNPVYYELNEKYEELFGNKNDKRFIGFVAQEIQKYFPEIVSSTNINNEEILSISYEKLAVILWEGMQEQQNEINKLKEKIAYN